jgi:hypothetical protein
MKRRKRTRDRARLVRALLLVAVTSAVPAALFACGSRTGLFADETTSSGGPGGGDGGADATTDRATSDVRDALPPIETGPREDASRDDCPDADSTLVYLVTEDNELMSYNPPSGAFRTIGILACPASTTATPFSMAVDRKGTAFVVFSDGSLFRVSTATGACVKTTYVSGQSGFQTFGMGFSTEGLGPAESLFVAGDGQGSSASGLARIDTTTFKLTAIRDFFPSIDRAELTGTGDGNLFAFYTKFDKPGSFVGQIDKTNARVVAESALPTVEQGQGWAFAFWGGDFYLFTAPGGGSTVTRFRPADGSVTAVGSWPSVIVGAGVSTCAPQ